jgi:hypothetical protein
MADLVITAANVVAGSNARKVAGILGATIAAGQTVYKDPTTGKYLLADNNSPTVAARTPDGIALNGGALNQPVTVQTGGDINVGAALTVGTPYFMSDTPGGICPLADLATGEFVTLLGIATAANNLKMGILVSGVAVP